MKKKFCAFLMILCMCLCLFGPSDKVLAASGSVSVSVSAGTVNIGDTVTVTAKASGPSGEKAVATMTVSYDSSVLQFVSCSATYGGGGSSVTATADSFTVTLKAVAAGTSSVSLSGSDGVVFDTNEELDSMSGSSTSVTVNNAASSGSGTGTGTNSGGGGTGTGTGSSGSGTGTGTDGTTGAGTGSSAANLSDDNSLKALTISPGTLSPEFSGPRTKYTATVANDVTNIAVTATPANSKAVVQSVTGNTDLVVGTNTISIVVRAENGVTATYKIDVTRKAAADQTSSEQPSSQQPGEDTTEQDTEQEPDSSTITVGGSAYRVVEDFAPEDIPADFTEVTVNYHEAAYKGLSFNKASLFMLCLVPEGDTKADGKFYIWEVTEDVLYPFVKLNHEANYVIALALPTETVLPDTYSETSVVLEDGASFSAFREESGEEGESEFFLFYGINQEGTEGWYRYDAGEGTYQRTSMVLEDEDAASDENMAFLQNEYNALSAKYTEEKAFSRNTMAIMIFIIAVLLIVIVNLLLYRRGGKDEADKPKAADLSGEPADADLVDADLADLQDEYVASDASDLLKKSIDADAAAELYEKSIGETNTALPETTADKMEPDLSENAAHKVEPDFAEKVTDEAVGEDNQESFGGSGAKAKKKEKTKMKSEQHQKTDDLEVIDFNDF